MDQSSQETIKQDNRTPVREPEPGQAPVIEPTPGLEPDPEPNPDPTPDDPDPEPDRDPHPGPPAGPDPDPDELPRTEPPVKPDTSPLKAAATPGSEPPPLVLTSKPVAAEKSRPAPRPKKSQEEPEFSPFSVLVGQVYDGPLDLLLDLIRKQDIDIYDIPIARITAQFLAYVNQFISATWTSPVSSSTWRRC